MNRTPSSPLQPSSGRPSSPMTAPVTPRWRDMEWGARLVALPVWGYRLLISPWLPPSCRYEPTCSAYALDALKLHGPVNGSILAARRIGRCHPWGGHGYDPVPGSEPESAGECGPHCGHDHSPHNNNPASQGTRL